MPTIQPSASFTRLPNEIGRQTENKLMAKIRLRHIGIAILLLKALLVGYLFIFVFPQVSFSSADFDSTFLWFVLAGFLAQMIDGTLGMAYGVSCSTILLNLGVPPKVASAAVHTAEVFTTGVSGLSHIRFRNLDKVLFFRIVFFGVLGAVVGSYLVSEILDGGMIKPYISGYLLILGVVILYKGIRNKQNEPSKVKRAGMLALFGGFFDSIGGGGWGPIVTSNLINQGKDPRRTIGTVNTAEFFVTFSSTSVFMLLIGVDSWKVIIGLVIGGVIAAPLGAYFAARVNKRTIMILIGIVISITSAFSIIKALL
jgi:uncharacterized membrane protein YfcA